MGCNMICPCKDCERKGCGAYHSQCQPYLDYAQWRKDINEIERKQKMMYAVSYAKRRKKWKEKK